MAAGKTGVEGTGMRLVCPNCEAKYEVPEDAIPETGR
ncbi:MAG: zinc-ribbon domain-containing protein, partial [Tabrizicola sp.]